MLKLPRVAAMQDISGFGKCALSVAIPVLSACGTEVCPIPCAALSANASFSPISATDLSPSLGRWLESWRAIGLKADALLAGFLASPAQAGTVSALRELLSPRLTVIDPAMADGGRLYSACSGGHIAAFRGLCRGADIVLPNLTELCLLAGIPYDPGLSPDGIARAAESLGAKAAAVTGIERGGSICVGLLSEGYEELAFPRLPFSMHGTGDLFAALLTGGLVTGHTLRDAVRSAAEFTAFAMEKSPLYPDFPRRGVCFEPYLHMLRGGVFRKDDQV